MEAAKWQGDIVMDPIDINIIHKGMEAEDDGQLSWEQHAVQVSSTNRVTSTHS